MENMHTNVRVSRVTLEVVWHFIAFHYKHEAYFVHPVSSKTSKSSKAQVLVETLCIKEKLKILGLVFSKILLIVDCCTI